MRETSLIAWQSLHDALPKMEFKLLSALEDAGDAGATGEELSDVTGMRRWSVSGRLTALTNRNLIRDSGLRRIGRSGRPSIVWIPQLYEAAQSIAS